METKILKEFCKKAKKLHSKKNTLPVLDNVLIKNGTLTFTNLEQTIVLNAGYFTVKEALIPLEFFKKIVEKSKDIDVSENENSYIIKIPGASYNVSKRGQGMQPQDFPILPRLKNPTRELINKKDVQRIKKSVAYAGNDELKPERNGVYVDTNNIVATDAHVLGFHKREKEKGVKPGYENEGQNPVLIPSKIVDLLGESHYFVRQDKNNVYIEGLDFTFIFRQVKGTYPKWKSVIPEESISEVNLETPPFKKALEQADLAANQAHHTGLLYNHPEKSLLNIRAKDIDFGYGYNCNLKVQNSNQSIMIGININLMLSILKTEKYERINIKFTGKYTALIINDEMLLLPLMEEAEIPSEEELKQEVIEA